MQQKVQIKHPTSEKMTKMVFIRSKTGLIKGLFVMHKLISAIMKGNLITTFKSGSLFTQRVTLLMCFTWSVIAIVFYE